MFKLIQKKTFLSSKKRVKACKPGGHWTQMWKNKTEYSLLRWSCNDEMRWFKRRVLIHVMIMQSSQFHFSSTQKKKKKLSIASASSVHKELIAWILISFSTPTKKKRFSSCIPSYAIAFIFKSLKNRNSFFKALPKILISWFVELKEYFKRTIIYFWDDLVQNIFTYFTDSVIGDINCCVN